MRRFHQEAWGQGHPEVLEEVLAEDYVQRVAGVTGWLHAAESPGAGRTAEAERIQAFRTDFPDSRITTREQVAESDRVAAWVTIAGTQSHPLDAWHAPNTGRPLERESVGFYHVACGRIAEGWILPDNLTLLRQ